MKDKFRLMDEADNRQISREIQGETVDEFVYSVEGSFRLSYAGVRYAAGLYGGIQVNKVECGYNEKLDQFEATVYAENRRTGITLPGTAEHPASQLVEGEQVRDMFARRTAVSKASRNAIIAVIPVEHVKSVIAQLQESTKSLSCENEVPVLIDSDSVRDYLKKHGAPVDSLKMMMDSHRNVVYVMPTRFLGSFTWSGIDISITKFAGAGWVKKRNRWEVPC